MLNTKRKLLVAFSLVMSLVIAQADLAQAIVWRFGQTESWNFPDGTGEDPYAPTGGQAYTRSWTEADQYPGSPYYIDTWMAGFWFSGADVSYIQGMYSWPSPRYFTADQSHPNECDATVSVEGYYTTVPNPHFDYDNDPEPGGCGYTDESEVTILNPGPLTAYWSYDFLTTFRDMTYGNTIGHFEANAQRSYCCVFGEYETDDYWLLATPNYDTRGLLGSLSSYAHAAESEPTTVETRAGPTPLPTDLAEYRALMLARQREIGRLWTGSLDVSVTFKTPESLGDFDLERLRSRCVLVRCGRHGGWSQRNPRDAGRRLGRAAWGSCALALRDRRQPTGHVLCAWSGCCQCFG